MVLSDYPMSSYLLILEPNEAVRESIMQVKRHFATQYDCPEALQGQPNISLLSWKQYEMTETRWMPMLQRIVQDTAPFQVGLSNFGSLPTHSIFFQVQTQTHLSQLSKGLRSLQSLIKPNKENKPHFIAEPYITLARKLLPWQYEKGWLEMAHTHFSASFMVSQLVLLRRRVEEEKYTAIRRMHMQGLREEVVQVALF